MSPRYLPLILISLGLGLGGCRMATLDITNNEGGTDSIVTQSDPADPEITPEDAEINPWITTADDATSTFSVDVDSGSYTLTRRTLNEGRWPNPESVRVEEFVNYFKYDDPTPSGNLPFEVSFETAPSTFAPPDRDNVQLFRVAIQAEQVPLDQRDPVNLVFLLDVSGSMSSPDKLGLVQFAMKQLVDKLSPQDTLGIVVYAGASGVVLQPTAVEDKSLILDALDSLQAGGSTNGEAGIRQAYNLAEGAFRDDGVNRVVLCTDGDFNVGVTGDDLTTMIEDFRDRGIFLTTLGFGMGNYQDDTMEQLADHGNGNYGYIDSQNEATRMLGENLVSTLQVVAKDTKLQISFNPEEVEAWRLIGYENRLLNDRDFADDTIDAGDIGAGHHVTALYELDMVGDGLPRTPAEVKIRFKQPNLDTSSEHIWKVANADAASRMSRASAAMQWAAAVTEFAEVLRDSPHVDSVDFDAIKALAEQARPASSRSDIEQEFLGLVSQARASRRP